MSLMCFWRGFIPSFGKNTHVSSPSAMTLKGAEGNGLFWRLEFEMYEVLLCFKRFWFFYKMFYKVLELACYDLYKKYVKLVIICHDFRINAICDDLEFLTWF